MALVFCFSPALCLVYLHKERMPEAELSVILQNSSTCRHLSILNHSRPLSNMVTLKEGAWHEDWHGDYCRNSQSLRNSVVQLNIPLVAHWRPTTGAAASFSTAPEAAGATCGSLIHHPSAANTSWQKMMTHFLQIFTFLPLCRPGITW